VVVGVLVRLAILLFRLVLRGVSSKLGNFFLIVLGLSGEESSGCGLLEPSPFELCVELSLSSSWVRWSSASLGSMNCCKDAFPDPFWTRDET